MKERTAQIMADEAVLRALGMAASTVLKEHLNANLDQEAVRRLEELSPGTARLFVLQILLADVMPRAVIDRCCAADFLAKVAVMLCRERHKPTNGVVKAPDVEAFFTDLVGTLEHAKNHLPIPEGTSIEMIDLTAEERAVVAAALKDLLQ